MKKKLACASNRQTVDGSFEVDCTPSPSPSPSEPCPSNTAPSDVLPSDVSPSGVITTDIPAGFPSTSDVSTNQFSPSDAVGGEVSPETSMIPSFVCLILGSDGRCVTPTPPCGANTGGSNSDATGGSPSDATFIPSNAVPSDAFVPSGTISTTP
jgi:hypothetical protein